VWHFLCALCDLCGESFCAYSTRIEPMVLERRCRVNVSGVVTPSPVGVAMLKLP
jgi:hypothetical protein